VRTYERVISDAVVGERVSGGLLMVFAVVALVLAGVGVFGVVSYSVSQRTYEIGVRMALGAQVGEVKGMIFRRGMVLALFGIALGLALYLPAAGVLVNRVYGARPVGWAPLLIAPAALLLVAALASYLPARRAALLNPAEALRVQ
jgi:ABC-type antimicrobial peptide transport system permease subunit